MKRVISTLLIAGSLLAQTAVVRLTPMAPGPVLQVGKWTVANSTTNFLITNPDGTTNTVAKAAALTQSVTVFALPANTVVVGCIMKTGTAFAGTTTLTGTLGVTGTLTACVSTPYDLNATVTATNLTAATLTVPVVTIAGTNALLALTATVSNISAISTGSVSIWITSYTLP